MVDGELPRLDRSAARLAANLGDEHLAADLVDEVDPRHGVLAVGVAPPRALGAEVVVGDLTRPESVAAALEGVGRMYFAMPVSPDHLLAATVVATVAREYGKLAGLVGMSQMTVSQMTVTSTAESRQQRLHWLAEQVLNWSGLPVVHIRPTSFLDNPLDRWRAEVLAKAGLPPHIEQHIATMGRLHRENRYDRASDDVERLTGTPAQTIEAFVADRRDFYLG